MKIIHLISASFILLTASFCYAATYTVVEGEKFTLKKGESAQLKNTNVVLTVLGFVNSPCPKNAQCIWSGLAVNHEFTIDGKKYKPYDTHYNVALIESDYKNSATYTITNAEDDCVAQGDGCWDAMMRRFKDRQYCYKMKNPVSKQYCLDNILKINSEKAS